MTTQVTATFVNGMLKPDEALPLADQSRVRLTIEPIEDWSPEAARADFAANLREREGDREGRPHGPIIVPITSLHPAPFELIREMHIVVQPSDDDFIATFFDANINASGDTQEEAVANFKDVMLSMFRRFSQEPENRLGPEPKRQLAVLRQFIREA